MSTSLNISDFQSLQDQLVDLKAKNYELSEKNRRSQADFEALKDKICIQQMRIEEQERNFESASSTLRQEIEAISNNKENENYKAKYRKLLLKAKELQCRYDKSVELVNQLTSQNEQACGEIATLKEKTDGLRDKLESLQSGSETMLAERDRFRSEVDNFDKRLAVEANERKISERRATQIIKDLRRQLALETSRSDTLQSRLEKLLSNLPTDTSEPAQDGVQSVASGGSSSNGHNGSWNFVDSKASNPTLNESLSLCSIHSEDRETVQQPVDEQQQQSEIEANVSQSEASVGERVEQLEAMVCHQENANLSLPSVTATSSELHEHSGMLYLDEQAALVDRVAQLQHDKWVLEEKLAYLEQTNSTLSEDLANKSDIVKRYFAAAAQLQAKHQTTASVDGPISTENRRASLSNNLNQILHEKPSLKKVVDFLKERSQVVHEPDAISREATKRMQTMLEETLIKCLKLEQSLDLCTAELDKLRANS